jgi:TetR/AcrR family transcriptional repressor of nem operon
MYIESVDTRERLIESTRELLWERGYTGTSPKAIQERSGAGQGSMYHHFQGKQELALAAIERNVADLVTRADADLDGPGTVAERVTRYMRRERAALRGCPVGRLTMDPDVMADPDLRRPVEDAFATVRDRLARVIDEGRRSGELDPSSIPRPSRPRWSRCCRAGTCSPARPARRMPTRKPSTVSSRCSPAAPPRLTKENPLMPFVRIDALRADQARLDGLGRAVHEALIDAIGIPADDLFQVLTSHDGATGTFRYDPDYLGVHRDDGIVYVDITMRAGRTNEQKKALYARIAELASKYADTEPRNVFVTIHENQFADWSFGNGVGQYLERTQ